MEGQLEKAEQRLDLIEKFLEDAFRWQSDANAVNK